MLRNIPFFIALAPILLACAPFGQTDIQAMSPEQASLMDSTCTQVMGLKQGQYQFALCRESLAGVVVANTAGQNMAAAYEQCSQRGLVEGTARFSTCMLESNAKAPPPQVTPIAYTGAPGTEPGKSFFDVTPHVRWNRERYSCAQLGLVPGSGAFGQCVARLESAFTPDPD